MWKEVFNPSGVGFPLMQLMIIAVAGWIVK